MWVCPGAERRAGHRPSPEHPDQSLGWVGENHPELHVTGGQSISERLGCISFEDRKLSLRKSKDYLPKIHPIHPFIEM